MSQSVSLPALGEGVTVGSVTSRLKKVGDRVEVDERLLEVSTDKVDATLVTIGDRSRASAAVQDARAVPEAPAAPAATAPTHQPREVSPWCGTTVPMTRLRRSSPSAQSCQ